MFDQSGRFIIDNYNKQREFSSFLPGISGVEGIPLWVFYVNRGQAVTSFGVENKNHSIMEFYPAHQAYQLTRNMGFRTFLKVDGSFYEPFRSDDISSKMYIGMNELEIEEINEELGLKIRVLYYTLPDEKVGGLVRTVQVSNISEKDMEIELLDGMPAVIPYGIELPSLKEMAQTMKAWMQVEDVEERLPYYRVRYSTKDSAVVSKVEEGNFVVSLSEDGERLPIIGDPELVFEYDTSYEKPIGFQKKGLGGLCKSTQITQNQMPSGFAGCRRRLGKQGNLTIYSVIGKAANKEILREFADKNLGRSYFDSKYQEAVRKTEELGAVIHTETANPIFDAYCKQTYIDNVLRGGFPIRIGEKNIFYVYSRKHGDIERDYNFFTMMPENYSQGNGNYRDVNQNRRSDVCFTPYVKEHNIKVFYNLIQLDGYNPLVVKQVTYQAEQISEILDEVQQDSRQEMKKFFEKEFSPGQLFAYLEQKKIQITCNKEHFLETVITHSSEKLNADFTEGYWTDHWTYNLDLIETYLSVYPEKEEQLLFREKGYTYYESKAIVKPRVERYVQTEQGVRQYHSIDEEVKRDVKNDRACMGYGSGEVYATNLMTKLMVLAVNKFATLDMYGMGIEMEGGKPGWYDALNGLPGIFGSSMAETYELYRLLKFIKKTIEKYKEVIVVPVELYQFMNGLDETLKAYCDDGKSRLWVWNETNQYKEAYRERTAYGVSGEEKTIESEKAQALLAAWMSYVNQGIKMAFEHSEGIPPTYYAYSFEDYEVEGNHIIPHNLKAIHMPLFLEGPVRYLKLPMDPVNRRSLYKKIKDTGLYDAKLHMYKVNESLDKASFEVGRAKAFSAGWLENESIWLHMEYKYLLELLKSELYKEFFDDFHRACIPFLDFQTYGRSLLENSSFIASSANVNTKIQGKGFVARLSGSTAEFLQMWQIMMFGAAPFKIRENELICSFEPAIPEYLIPESKRVVCTFLGKINVVYRLEQKKDIIPGEYQITQMKITYKTGKTVGVADEFLPELQAQQLRNGEIEKIEVTIQSR